MKKPLKHRFGVPKPLPQFNTYHVYDPNATSLGGVRVTEDVEKKTRTVKLTKENALYWQMAGVIGEKPLASLSGKGQEAVRQFLGQKKDDKEKTPKAYGDKPEAAKEAPPPSSKSPVTHRDSVRG